jgi:hypothetical protein
MREDGEAGKHRLGGMTGVAQSTSPSKLLVVSRDVAAFVDLFLDLFAAGDVAGITRLWDTPALVLGDEQVHGAMSLAQLEKLFLDAVFAQASQSFPGSEQIESVEWISRRVAMVELPWPQRSVGGFLRGVEATTFFLRIDQRGHLKIRALMLRGSGD